MKLHPDGTVEGTPEEIAAYMRLKQPQNLCNWPPYISPNPPITGTGPQIAYCDSTASTVK